MESSRLGAICSRSLHVVQLAAIVEWPGPCASGWLYDGNAAHLVSSWWGWWMVTGRMAGRHHSSPVTTDKGLKVRKVKMSARDQAAVKSCDRDSRLFTWGPSCSMPWSNVPNEPSEVGHAWTADCWVLSVLLSCLTSQWPVSSGEPWAWRWAGHMQRFPLGCSL